MTPSLLLRCDCFLTYRIPLSGICGGIGSRSRLTMTDSLYRHGVSGIGVRFF